MDIGSLVSGGLGSGGGNQLMGLVMSQASKAVTGGGQEKQSMMNGAAMTLTKLVAQKQLSSFIGGSNSGGLGMLGSVGGSVRMFPASLRPLSYDFHVVPQKPISVMGILIFNVY
ncbi:hypothetical protein OG21DRAFT_1275394 [Imleria badia]|nr:hypothetical protein OG21DRAFT_1275394 [Imleria badia]